MLEISGLTKSFGSHEVLCGVDLNIPRGESLVILGGSGSGKSVTIKCIMGFLPPDGGSIKLEGREIVGISGRERFELNRRFGLLFQHAALLDSLPVWQNVMFAPLRFGRVSRREARKQADGWLERVGIERAIARELPGALSAGVQKRIGLARAIAGQPDVLLFDEPTTGLDAIVGAQIDDLIRDIVTDMGATAITITHDIASARDVADQVDRKSVV